MEKSDRAAVMRLRGGNERTSVWLAVMLLVGATVGVYFNSLGGGWVFDDLPGIVENPTIRSFSPPWQPLIPPPGGSSVVGRPIVNFSFAINHAIGGLDPRGYHVVNLLIHLAAGLALFGIVRRTLERLPTPGWRRGLGRPAAARERGADGSCNLIGYTIPSAVAVAASVALVWLVHPLQTESVTFVVQRTESLGGLFYLLTLYAFVRATEGSGVIRTEWPQKGAKNQNANEASDAPRGARESSAGQTDLFRAALRPFRLSGRGWFVVSFLSCLIGVATKEILATAPLILLLYDRTFVAGTFGTAWRERRRFYLGLAASWLLLAVLMWSASARGGTVALGKGVSVWTTLLTQCKALATYLKLCFWPHPLVVDYGDYASDAVRSAADVWPQGLLILALLAATVFALIKRPALGFLGAWFFVILAPSSSFIPLLTQARAEHRMYLPLAAVVVLSSLVLWRCVGRHTVWLLVALAVPLGWTTIERNRDYHSETTLWSATVRDWPQNPRAHYNLAVELGKAGDRAGAIRAYETSLRLDPQRHSARVNFATTLLAENRIAEARVQAEAAVKLDPTSAAARNTLGRVRFEAGEVSEAVREFREALRREPNNAGVQKNLAMALAAQGEFAGAIEQLQRSIVSEPKADTRVILGEMLQQMNRLPEARASLEEAVREQPDHGMAHFHLGNVLMAENNAQAAVPHYQAAAKAMPTSVPPHYNLSYALQALGRTDEAIASIEHVLRLAPNDAGAKELLETLRGRRPQ